MIKPTLQEVREELTHLKKWAKGENEKVYRDASAALRLDDRELQRVIDREHNHRK